MTGKKVVLVTGVSKGWGKRVASELVTRPGLHIIGLDREKPDPEIKGLDFIQADIRNPHLVDLLQEEKVEVLCHLAFMETRRPDEQAFDFNVIGTMKVFGACAQASVKKIVIMSTTAVYGANPNNPAFLREEHPLKNSSENGYLHDMLEIESFCNGFRLQAPEITLTLLRFPSIIGPSADTPMTRLLKQPFPPVLLGFDPMVQIIHESDVVAAILFSIDQDIPGVYNVAAEGVMPLDKLIKLAGKQPLPVFHLFAYWGTDLLNLTGLPYQKYAPVDIDYLRYTWVSDLSKMHDCMGFTPHYTAEEALREFAGFQRMRPYQTQSSELEHDEKRLKDTIERRRRLRQRQSGIAGPGDVMGDLDNEEEGGI
ncbi:MAG: NAD-dependent epimerase/dehydratase family protein [Omnitrophica WOR_2 bacterium]